VEQHEFALLVVVDELFDFDLKVHHWHLLVHLIAVADLDVSVDFIYFTVSFGVIHFDELSE
jgi:hypothetical protein